MDAIKNIEAFFRAYEKRFNEALNGQDNIEETIAAFADCFVGANPGGVFCGANNEDFKKAVVQGNEFYRNIGTISMNIDRIEVTQLNSVHFMAKVSWVSVYNKDDKHTNINFVVIYLLQQHNESFKIFCYITEDEQKALREHGIMS